MTESSRREALGRLVRETWCQWAREQPDISARSSWLLPWEDIDDGQREVDMRIGEAIAADERQNMKTERILSAVFVARSQDCPQPFGLYRHQDVTGVSGQGTVAYGTQFADGKVVIRWLGERPSTVVWDSLDDAMAVHDHDGRTQVVWLAAPFSEMAEAEREAVAAERARAAGEGKA